MAEHISMQTLRRQAIFWICVMLAFIAFLVVFRSILLPFIAGFAVAYFLDPVADWLERRGLSRISATTLILLTFLVLLIAALVVILPVLITQASGFFARVPTYIERIKELIGTTNLDNIWIARVLGLDSESIRSGIDALVQQSSGFVTTIVQGVWSSGAALIGVISLLVVTPVVAFYMLLDWDRMVARVDSWVPRRYLDDVRRIGREVNEAIAGFVRGQGTVCLILGVFYGVALSLAGLNFGLLIGLVAGLISFVPYVGSLIGLVLSVGVALVQFWPDGEAFASGTALWAYARIAIVAGIFMLGQFVEGNILQPKLVGDSVGLHPVWLMFALFAFGSLFGFAGLLIAVPAAAAIGVLVRFAIEQYKDSDLYSETSPGTDAQ